MPITVVAIFFSQYVTDFSTDVLSLNGHLKDTVHQILGVLLFKDECKYDKTFVNYHK